MEVSLTPISFKGLRRRIERAFGGDTEFLNNHTTPGCKEGIAEHNYRRIVEGRKAFPELKAYDLRRDGQSVGFSVLCHEPFPMLYSFGLNMDARKDGQLKTKWLTKLHELMDDIYLVPLYEVNTRAINFFKKHGYREEKRDEATKIVFLSWPYQQLQD